VNNPQVLLRLAKLSAAAYRIVEDDVRSAVNALDYTYVARIADEDCVALVVTEEVDGKREAVVAFQGTRFYQNTDPQEIWDDLDDTALDLGPKGRVHRGFYAPVAERWPLLRMALPLGCTTVTFTGHSLGGVRANLAQRLAVDDGYETAAVSFGAPKGADRQFWMALGHDPVRVVHKHDFAPLWPLVDARWVQPEPMTWISPIGRIEQVVGWRGLLPSVGDHSIDKYITSLEGMTANLDTASATV
jgi:hypothetical protein